MFTHIKFTLEKGKKIYKPFTISIMFVNHQTFQGSKTVLFGWNQALDYEKYIQISSIVFIVFISLTKEKNNPALSPVRKQCHYTRNY